MSDATSHAVDSMDALTAGGPGVSIAVAFVWIGVIGLSLGLGAAFERRARLANVVGQADFEPPRRGWGGDPDRAPGTYRAVRAFAHMARLARGRTWVVESLPGLRRFGRGLALASTAGALALIPLAGPWAGRVDAPCMVVANLENGLLAIVFLILLSGWAQTATGLAERTVWARLGGAPALARSLVGVPLVFLVLAPVVLAAGSLRPQDIVAAQQTTFSPLSLFAARFGGALPEALLALRLPGWFLFTQPITALLFVPTLVLLLRRPRIDDAFAGTRGIGGFGLDSDPSDLYWARLEARLATLLGAALFVSLFLGGSGLPGPGAAEIVALGRPFVGENLPALAAFLAEVGVFFAKLVAVLFVASLARRAHGLPRVDQMLGTATGRWMPLAWANLLLLAALSLLRASLVGGTS